MDEDAVAVGELVDERRTGDDPSAGRQSLADASQARERVRSYLLAAGCVRPDEETAWRFGRRVVGDAFFVTEFCGVARETGDDDTVTLCLLPERGTVVFDHGGTLLENEFVAAFLGGYFEFHGGSHELHAQPLESEQPLRETVAALEAHGLVGDDAAGPFADAFDGVAEELRTRLGDGP